MIQKILYGAIAAMIIVPFVVSIANAGSGRTAADGCHKHKGMEYPHCHKAEVERLNRNYDSSGDNQYRVTLKDGTVLSVGVDNSQEVQALQSENSALKEKIVELETALAKPAPLTDTQAYNLCFETVDIHSTYSGNTRDWCQSIPTARMLEFLECFNTEIAGVWFTGNAVNGCKEVMGLN